MIENKIIKRRLIRVKGEGEEESDEKVERNIEREREKKVVIFRRKQEVSHQDWRYRR